MMSSGVLLLTLRLKPNSPWGVHGKATVASYFYGPAEYWEKISYLIDECVEQGDPVVALHRERRPGGDQPVSCPKGIRGQVV